MKPENVTCPECDGPMVPRTSQYGKFWGCKAYPRCKGTRNVEGEAPQRFDNDSYQEAEETLPSERQRGNDRKRWDEGR